MDQHIPQLSIRDIKQSITRSSVMEAGISLGSAETLGTELMARDRLSMEIFAHE
jgi:hypothetical protein